MDAVAEKLYELVDFHPTELQTKILGSDKRFILVAGGEQAGKSMVASKFLLQKFMRDESPGLYWLVAADYERTRAEFEYLAEDFAKIGVLSEVSKRVDPGKIVLSDGTRIETKSAKDPEPSLCEPLMVSLAVKRHNLTLKRSIGCVAGVPRKEDGCSSEEPLRVPLAGIRRPLLRGNLDSVTSKVFLFLAILIIISIPVVVMILK